MKKGLFPIFFLLCLALLGCASGESPARVILYGVYRPVPDSDSVSVGCLDAAGDLWLAEKAELSWPASLSGAEAMVTSRTGMKLQENVLDALCDGYLLDSDWLSDLAAMADCMPVMESEPQPTGLDCGRMAVYALRTGENGKPESVLLGMAGSSLFENTDPGAQLMYRFMWRELTLLEVFNPPAGYAAEGVEPHGFETTSLREFFNLPEGAENAEISAGYNDCLAGFSAMQLSPEDLEDIRTLVRRGVVTGKQNAAYMTGGTVLISFSDAGGDSLGSMELYRSESPADGSLKLLAVSQDGMYTVSLLPEPVDTLPEGERNLLAFTLKGEQYTLGKTTPRDLIRQGWICFPELSGALTFDDGKTDFVMEIRTAGGSVDEPVLSVYMENYENEAPFAFGFDGVVNTGEDTDTTLRLSDGRSLRIGADDDSVSLALLEPGAVTDENDLYEPW